MRLLRWVSALGWAGLVVSLAGMLGCASSKPKEPQQPVVQRPSGYPQPYHLLPLFTLNNTRLSQTASLMAKTGNKQEKDAAGLRLVQLAESIASEQWREAQRPMIRRMQAQTSPLTRSDETRKLDDWQKRYLVRVYNAMSALGGKPVLDHCRLVINDGQRRVSQHQMALAVLSAHDQTRKVQGNDWSMPKRGTPGKNAETTAALKTVFGAAPEEVAAEKAAPKQEAPRVVGGTITNLKEVVGALLPYFYICYRRAYDEHGRFGAWLILNARVAGDGTVRSVFSKGDESIPYSMMKCLKDVAKQARFAPPKGDPTVVIPLSFVPNPSWDAQTPQPKHQPIVQPQPAPRRAPAPRPVAPRPAPAPAAPPAAPAPPAAGGAPPTTVAPAPGAPPPAAPPSNARQPAPAP